jgi:hypothetical protein
MVKINFLLTEVKNVISTGIAMISYVIVICPDTLMEKINSTGWRHDTVVVNSKRYAQCFLPLCLSFWVKP